MSDNPENLPARIDNGGGTLALIKTAIDKGIDPEALGKLLDLQDRVLAKQAESEFTQAKKRFQARCPVINKNRHADIKGGAKYSFADLENITQTIRPLLEEHGFSWSFTQRHNGDIVEVVCILKHESGHKEETSFSAPWTTNAGMSPMQKYASATTFCQRYALRLALGLPVGEDNDGREEYEKPGQREDAPTVAERAERITSDDIKKLSVEWRTQQFGEPAKEDFVKWALATVGGEWNPARVEQWSRTKLNTCYAALGVPE